MKRRNFIHNLGLTAAALTAGVNPIGAHEVKKDSSTSTSSLNTPSSDTEDWPKRKDNWLYLGNGQKLKPKRFKEVNYDVMVIGGGIAGICAAVSAARHGSKVLLVQDRPMLGGNASSEMHVPINGSYHLENKFGCDRETGVVEELQLTNKAYNPYCTWEIWDHMMYTYADEFENLTIELNIQAIEALMDGNKISSAICWQTTTETKWKVNAKIFIDCSGDGLLAASAGAEYRTGRESRHEFNESFAPEKADGWCMGDSIQFLSTDMGKPVTYKAPPFAIPYDFSKAYKRKINGLSCGFWWVELGSDYDIIAVREENRNKLAAYTFGVWDYVKNSGKFPEAENLALTWVGSIAGRRESRRFMGDYLLNQNDLMNYRHFEDAVGFGGWSLDEHCPGGMDNLKDPPSFFHSRFNKQYEIPYRCLYSKNIENLMFAGRNVSVTHMALSSTRVMGTCSTMGQAVGTAAALCLAHQTSPRGIYQKHLMELQEMLLRDDAYIPNRKANDPKDLATQATLKASSTSSGNVALLTDGISRDLIESVHHWASEDPKASVTLTWEKPVSLQTVEIKADTNLHQEIELHPNKLKMETQDFGLPPELIKTLSVEAKINGQWKEIARKEDNIFRLIKLHFTPIQTQEIRIRPINTYGSKTHKLFEIRCYS